MSKTISISDELTARIEVFRPKPAKGKRKAYSDVISEAMDLLEAFQNKKQENNM